MPKRNDIKKVLIIGSGPIIIGQACEFDYSGTQACKALKKLGFKIVLVNSNPATIMTDPQIADSTYIEPLNIDTLAKIIELERPDALLPNLGGQTGLNLSSELYKAGILDKYNVKIIGVQADAIERGEDRTVFKDTMSKLGIEVPKSTPVDNIDDAFKAAEEYGLPVVVRPFYTMGGTGSGIAYNKDELIEITLRGLSASLVKKVLIEESVIGWEELELEVVRDSKNQMITVCFIENIDPMGIHTGDSFCAAPMLTIDEKLQKRLQKYSYDIVEAIQVIGGTNIQFAHNPETGRVVVIEINPRTSRSSALASKATGFPIAYVSALLAGGLTMDEIPYWRDGTLEKYTPSGDYVVIKFARWNFEKFPGVKDILGTQMKAVGEAMSIGKNYKEAFQKAIRSMENGRYGLGFAKNFNSLLINDLLKLMSSPSSERQFIMYEALRKGAGVDKLHNITKIKSWFIEQMKELVELEEEILKYKGKSIPGELLIKAKKDGFSDKYLALITNNTEDNIRKERAKLKCVHNWDFVPVSGVENASYYYSTYNSLDKVKTNDKPKVIVLGGGPNRIGQGIEFDYCCVHAAFTLRDEGFDSIMINCNPETVSTDYDTSDKLYFEPLTVEDVLAIYEKEKPIGVIVQFGGQTPLNISEELMKNNVKILGSSPDTIQLAEDRDRFRKIMEKLGIPQPESEMASNIDEALKGAHRIGYPVMVRPSYVLGGRAMQIVYDDEMLKHYVNAAVELSPDRPILIDKFLSNAIEVEADAISDGVDAFVPTIMEHIEFAGVHSGDSACVIPPVSIMPEHLKIIEDYTKKIALELNVVGLINIQYAIHNNKVYILEANPRASRTVPLVSKVCNIPMIKIAVQLMLGKKLKDLNIKHNKIKHFGVKESIFPFNMFPEVDPLLGPEMRSTGEVLGIAETFGLAFSKAEEAASQKLPTEGSVLITVNKNDREDALKIAKDLASLGFNIFATSGIYKFFHDNGIVCEKVLKLHEGRPNLCDKIMDNTINLVINTPGGKQSDYDDSYIRKAAIVYKIPYITTISAAKASVKGIQALKTGKNQVKSLQDYHSEIVKE